MNRRPLLLSALTVALVGLVNGATAQAAWPSRPIRLVVPFAPGGGSDIVSRLLGNELSTMLGVPFVIDNKPGMAASIGADVVAKSPPDGYTILFCTPGVQITNPYLYDKLPYDAEKAFTPVILIAKVPNLLVIHPSLPVNSVAELIAYGKANPGKLTFASTGAGSSSHLAGELFKSRAGIDMVHIPYKGSAPAMVDLLAGRVHLTIDSIAATNPQVQKGAMRALGLSTLQRLQDFPNIPAIAETIPGFEGSSVIYIAAPAGTPPEIVQRLNTAFNQLMVKPEIAARLRGLGMAPEGGAPEALNNIIATERVKWKRVIEISGAKAE